MKTIKQFIFGFLLLAAVPGCISNFIIDGNGVEATETRSVAAFSQVKSSGSFDVHISPGNSYEVLVIAEETIIPYIETTISGNTLLIDIRGMHNIHNQLPITIYVTTPTLASVKLSGSGHITTGYFTSDMFEMFLSGSGSVTAAVNAKTVDAGISGSGFVKITGSATQTNFSVSGSGDIDAQQLESDHCQANISGSGNMRIFALKTINAKISGSGNIYYTGNPDIDLKISGSGKVISEN